MKLPRTSKPFNEPQTTIIIILLLLLLSLRKKKHPRKHSSPINQPCPIPSPYFPSFLPALKNTFFFLQPRNRSHTVIHQSRGCPRAMHFAPLPLLYTAESGAQVGCQASGAFTSFRRLLRAPCISFVARAPAAASDSTCRCIRAHNRYTGGSARRRRETASDDYRAAVIHANHEWLSDGGWGRVGILFWDMRDLWDSGDVCVRIIVAVVCGYGWSGSNFKVDRGDYRG